MRKKCSRLSLSQKYLYWIICFDFEQLSTVTVTKAAQSFRPNMPLRLGFDDSPNESWNQKKRKIFYCCICTCSCGQHSTLNPPPSTSSALQMCIITAPTWRLSTLQNFSVLPSLDPPPLRFFKLASSQAAQDGQNFPALIVSILQQDRLINNFNFCTVILVHVSSTKYRRLNCPSLPSKLIAH